MNGPRRREGMRLAVQLLAGTGAGTGKLTGAADEISAYLNDCPPELYPGAIAGDLEELNEKLEKIMSEDAAIQAVTADITTQLTSLSSLISQVLAEIQNDSVQPSTVSALQAAQAGLDSTVAGFGTSVNPPAASTPPAAPAS